MPAVKSKTVLIVVVSLATLMMVSAGSVHIVLADPLHCDQLGWPSCYSVGYQDGLANRGTSCPAGHSGNFCRGWNDGASSSGRPLPPPLPRPSGPNYIGICRSIQFALLDNCANLINPNNTLTQQGTHVRDCIEGGALLAGTAIVVFHYSPFDFASALPTIAQLAGCGDVVDWTKLTLGQLKGLGPQLR